VLYALSYVPKGKHHVMHRPLKRKVRELYSPQNDPDPEMIPNPEMIPKSTPKIIPTPK